MLWERPKVSDPGEQPGVSLPVECLHPTNPETSLLHCPRETVYSCPRRWLLHAVVVMVFCVTAWKSPCVTSGAMQVCLKAAAGCTRTGARAGD